jgi:hypothetical protein
MDDSSSLDWLTHWYEQQCDGQWEHSYGVTIDTLDNPGWALKIDLSDTPQDGQAMERLTHNMDHETDWWTCWTENNQFHGAGGPGQLAALVETFRAWTKSVR